MSNVKKFEDWLNEQCKYIIENYQSYSFGCAMVYFDLPAMETMHSQIAKEDIYTSEEEGNPCGLESEPHVTLLYGIHDKVVEDDRVLEACMKFHIGDIILHNVSLFENENYDVLKFDVRYPINGGAFLHNINSELTKLPNTNNYKDYNPHCTIAYLQPGSGKKYVKLFNDLEFEVKPKQIVYSKSDGQKIIKKIA